MKKTFLLTSIIFLTSSIVYASPELEASIQKSKDRMGVLITKTQRSMKKDCGTKMKVTLDYSALEPLKINDKYTQFLRMRKKITMLSETLFKKCNKSNFKQQLKKYKKIEITATTSSSWRVKGRSGKILIEVGENTGDNFENLLEKKI